jgi:uncharacterized protein with PhoU and TrkA domain
VSEEDGEIRYKPVSVRALLTEIQSITELMVDLAYSSVLFSDPDLAEEVVELEERIDYLKTLLRMNTAIAVRDREDAEAMIGIMRVASAADRISDAAGEIAKIILLGLTVDPFVVEALKQVDERLIRARILPASVLGDKTLRELGLGTHIGVDVIAIRRHKQLLINPTGSTTLRAGDILIARGSDVGTLELDKLAKAELSEVPQPKVG